MLDEHDAFLWYGSVASARTYLERQAVLQARWQDTLARGWADEGPDEAERFGEYSDFVTAYDDVAIVSINGSLGYKETMWSRFFGDMTYESLANIMAMLVADGGVSKVVLDIDSPGGVAKGISVASDAIHAARNAGLSVVAHTSGDMLSAAYWIGSAAERTHAAKSAEVGSVGVLLVHHELTKMLDEQGVKVTVFRKGEEKALGSPYEKLDDKARASIDKRLETSYTSFIDTVASHRGLSADFVRTSVATGAVFSALEAQELGLVDSIQSFNQLVNNLMPKAATNSLTGATAMSKTPILTAKAPEGLESLLQDMTDPVVAAAVPVAEDDEPAGEDVVEGEDEGEEEGEDEAVAAVPTGGFTEMLSTLNSQLVDARVALERVTAERDELQAGNVGLRQIVIEQTQNLRIRLGQAAGSDLEALPNESLVATHQAAKADFVSRFKPGPVSQAPSEDTQLPKAAVTRLDLAVKRATSIGK